MSVVHSISLVHLATLSMECLAMQVAVDVTSSGSAHIEQGSEKGSEHASTQHLMKCDDTRHINFSEFIEKHKRTYKPNSKDYADRESLYNERLRLIDQLNCNSSWRSGVTHLADWTDGEMSRLWRYKRQARNPKTSRTVTPRFDLQATRPKNQPLPDSFSWQKLQSIKEGRDQAACGSCWAFAAEEAMRAHSEIHVGRKPFAVAQLVDCVPNPQECGGKGGCEGATCELAFDYALKNGLKHEREWPYAGFAHQCPEKLKIKELSQMHSQVEALPGDVLLHRSSAGHSNSMGMFGWMQYPQNKGIEMMHGLVKYGPASVAISVNGMLSFYMSGILTKDGCSGRVVNYAVLLLDMVFRMARSSGTSRILGVAPGAKMATSAWCVRSLTRGVRLRLGQCTRGWPWVQGWTIKGVGLRHMRHSV